MDYEALGLRVGLEIHAQLDTEKLFCSCPTILEDSHDYSYERRLRPTMSELGEIDPAAKEEFTKGIVNIYKGSLEGTCLVYADEEPPHQPNEEAIYILLQISSLLKADIVDQIQFMRKIVIDGSNVSGFQRTAL
ncbi:MAG TPA: Glu-tRNA(Gln) amidotransferase GatDE subunit E, partial [Candidatus Methanofastidiosa archaeon]|nr:Glu-tRNA(Gln) amidotransferase GatDE subunit E [Candidatus Methanofastidiosa archaeon]